MGPEMRFGSFLRSRMAATGIPKFETGPVKQKKVVSV
jgi:hypothetical protein